MIDLYHRNTRAKSASPGLSLVPKLTYEHINLTNFLVDLAVQVCHTILSYTIKFNVNCVRC